MAKTNTAASGMPPQASSGNVTNPPQNTFGQNMPSSVNPPPSSSLPPVVQPVSVPGATGVSPFAGLSNAPNYPANLPMGQSNMQSAPPPPMIAQAPGPGLVTPEAFQQPLQILQALHAQGVPQDQWATVLSVLMSSGAAQAPNPNFPPQQPSWQQPNGTYAPREDASRDRNGYNNQFMRSPPGRHRNRSRSRSPAAWDRRREVTPPRRRDSPVYGDYDGDGSGRNNNGRGNFGRSNRGNGANNDYRQRSPTQDRFRRSASPRRPDSVLPPPGPKWMEFDRTMAEGTIKGKSYSRQNNLGRTFSAHSMHMQFSAELYSLEELRKSSAVARIFRTRVGFFNIFLRRRSSEDVLRGIFSAFGTVQTCIVNVDKRHAFVKMITRRDAMAAKDGMERFKSPDMQLRVRA